MSTQIPTYCSQRNAPDHSAGPSPTPRGLSLDPVVGSIRLERNQQRGKDRQLDEEDDDDEADDRHLVPLQTVIGHPPRRTAGTDVRVLGVPSPLFFGLELLGLDLFGQHVR